MPNIILGKCPECESLDTIVGLPYKEDFSNYHKVRCENCETQWDNWLNGLVFPEREKGNKLIPVELARYGDSQVVVNWPYKEEIPYNGLIATILNSALITKYNLRVCLATEGGLENWVKGFFQLRNIDHNLGLYFCEGIHTPKSKKVLDLYEKMLRQLFVEPLSFGNVNFRRAEILRLEEKEENYSDALILLFGTLTVIINKEFAKKVLETKKEIERNPFSAPYIRGLTNEEIAKFFVPPPIK